MKSWRTRVLWIISLAIVGLSVIFWTKWTYGGVPLRVNTHREERLVVRSVFRLSNLLFVHKSDARLLFVDGRRFTTLRGGFPFFLRVPNARAIIFVTDENLTKRTNGTIYYYDFYQRRLTRILCDGFTFGYGIRDGHDQIESFNGKLLVLRSEATFVRQRIVIDIESGRVAIETEKTENTHQP